MKDYSEYELQVLMRLYNLGKKKGYLEILINKGLTMIKPTDSQAVILWGRMSNYLLFQIFRASIKEDHIETVYNCQQTKCIHAYQSAPFMVGASQNTSLFYPLTIFRIRYYSSCMFAAVYLKT